MLIAINLVQNEISLSEKKDTASKSKLTSLEASGKISKMQKIDNESATKSVRKTNLAQ